ncbi:S-type pyocin domain-containing protein [uncultured Shewanella sp.]|uniref:S-type pyocin domain-containing protein n=1 Tax=uncultured Shewanella sp. TaxID=173975 RepID=UPI0026250CEC|nr:S-type pyocin domain-containing protein [uncultured Shewanella sp.]
MSGKVVQLHQLMEHEALSIETDFTHLKDNDFKSYIVTGESLSSLKTALTRGEKLLLLEKPRAPMFIMDFPKAELSTEDRVKIILHSLKPMQVRQVHSTINPTYPKEVIKAIDNRLGTAGGTIAIGGNPYKSPSSDNLHPPSPMKPRSEEPVIKEPKPKPTGPDKFAKFKEQAYGQKVFAKSIVLGKHVSDMRTEVESAKNFGVLSLFSLNANPISPKNNYQAQTLLLKRADTREADRGTWSFSGASVSCFPPYTQLFAMWAKDTGGAQYESFDFPVMVEATTRVRFYYQLPSEQALKNDSTLDKNKPILKAVHTDERQVYPDKVKVIQAVMDGDGIRADLTDELSLHWRPSTASHDTSANTAPQSNESANTLSEEINNALWDLKVHPQTEENTNDIVEPNLEVIVNFPAELKLKAVYLALHTGEDDEMDKKWLTVPKGKLTFDVEGNDREGHMYFSRKAHIPTQRGVTIGNSGVTIGRGLDLGNPPTAAQNQTRRFDLEAILTKAGISPKLKKWLLDAKGLVKNDAQNYLANAADLGLTEKDLTLTRKQQHIIFNETYDFIEDKTRCLITKADVQQHYGKINWDNLADNVKEVLTDLTYRGDNTGSDDKRGSTRKWFVPAIVSDQQSGTISTQSKFFNVMNHKKWMSTYGVNRIRMEKRIEGLK